MAVDEAVCTDSALPEQCPATRALVGWRHIPRTRNVAHAMSDHDPNGSPARTAARFAAQHHHAVLVTHRRNGELQSSPIAVVAGDDDHLWISTRAGSAKERNLRRDPRASLTMVTDRWFGQWLHVDATGSVVRLPDAMPMLEEYYRRAAGEHPDWEDYRRAMREENRVVLVLEVVHVAGQ